MTQFIKYDLEVIQDEVRLLLEQGAVNRQQPIYVLSKYIPVREWPFVERELEEKNFLLSDRINNLIDYNSGLTID